MGGIGQLFGFGGNQGGGGGTYVDYSLQQQPSTPYKDPNPVSSTATQQEQDTMMRKKILAQDPNKKQTTAGTSLLDQATPTKNLI